MQAYPLALSQLRRGIARTLQLAVLLALMGSDYRHAQADTLPRLSEYQIKAAFLCKFGNFVQWPPHVFSDDRAPLIIAVAGTSDIADEVVRAASGVLASGRSIVVRVLHRGDSLSGVHVLFVARSADNELSDWLAAARLLPVLTVTESDQGLALGSIINFVMVDNKVRFDVAPPASERSAVRVDSRLLGVARKIVARLS